MKIRGIVFAACAAMPALAWAQGVIPTNNAAIFSAQPVTPSTGSPPVFLSGAISRPLGNIINDVNVNVKDFGAVLNGTTDDSAAFQAAYAAAPQGATIFVPPGGWQVNDFPTTNGQHIWKLSGNSYQTGTDPVAGVGNDVEESVLTNGDGTATDYIVRNTGAVDQGPIVRIDGRRWGNRNSESPNSGGVVLWTGRGQCDHRHLCCDCQLGDIS